MAKEKREKRNQANSFPGQHGPMFFKLNKLRD
jgi:hypothetical protein